jgi:HSP20 family protein
MKNMFANAWGYPPVNVEEFDDRYEIKLYAAGYAKSDFKVNLKDDTLTIAVERPENEWTDWANLDWQKFTPGGFERRFKLNEKIDKASITAKYEEGVLTVTLQKLPGFETSRQDIEVD